MAIFAYSSGEQLAKRREAIRQKWKGLCASSAGCLGSIPGQGTKIPHAAWHGQKKKKRQKWKHFQQAVKSSHEEYGAGDIWKSKQEAGSGVCPLVAKPSQRIWAWGSVPIPGRSLARERLVLTPRKDLGVEAGCQTGTWEQ